MHLAFDTSSLTSPHQYRGLGFYTKRLFKALKAKNLKITVFSQNPPENCDLIHYPAFTLFQKPPKKSKKPVVVTVHDLIPLKYPKHFPLGLKARINWFIQKRFLASCQAIITDSKASKKDIIKLIGIKPLKIHVVYLAPDPVFKSINNQIYLQKIKKRYQLPQKFVLFVGDLNWNKNIVNLTKTCLSLKLPLVVIGKSAVKNLKDQSHPELKDLRQFVNLAKKNPEQILRLGFVPTKDLVAIYNLAICLCLPSRDEGFGLPVLEAFASGCPVICSNQGSLPEVCGQAALIINPYHKNELQKALKKLFHSKTLPNKLKKLGLNRAQQFSWNKTAAQTIKVYEKVVN